MEWYNYIYSFLAGIFLANFVPHFVNGISGNRFPTPFAKPRGKGLSSPLLNIAWGLFNLIAGYILFRMAHVSGNNYLSVILLFIGLLLMSIRLSLVFSGKHKDQ